MERLNYFKNSLAKTRLNSTENNNEEEEQKFNENASNDIWNQSLDSETIDLSTTEASEELLTATSSKSINMFKCNHCPFVCNQLIRLSRHENKHFVKADHKVVKKRLV